MRNRTRPLAPIDDEEFPAELVKRRRRLGLSQIELGELVDTEPTIISRFERERRAIPYPRWLHLSVLAIELLGADAVREELARRSR